MKNKVVTLFGGGGFIGRYVTQALLQAGARVRVAGREPRDAWFLKPLGGLGQTQFIAADLTKPDSVARAVAGADAVVNLVGSFEKPEAINARGAATVAKAAAQAGVARLAHVSAIGADRGAPSAYGRSKGEGEAAVAEAFPAATIVRPSVVFGREDQFLNRFADIIAKASAVPIVRVVPMIGAATRFQPVYVGDVAAAIVAALGDEEFAGRTFELGGPDVLTMAELQRWIAGVIGRKPAFVAMPDALAGLVAALPGAPVSRDQLRMLKTDNVVAPGADGLAALGIAPTPMATVAPSWLVRFRRHGRFGSAAAA